LGDTLTVRKLVPDLVAGGGVPQDHGAVDGGGGQQAGLGEADAVDCVDMSEERRHGALPPLPSLLPHPDGLIALKY
jgi:hypothetical protein